LVREKKKRKERKKRAVGLQRERKATNDLFHHMRRGDRVIGRGGVALYFGRRKKRNRHRKRERKNNNNLLLI